MPTSASIYESNSSQSCADNLGEVGQIIAFLSQFDLVCSVGKGINAVDVLASPFEETREVAVRVAAQKLTPEQFSEADREAKRKSRHVGPRGRDAASHRYRNLFLEEAGRLLNDDCFGLHLAIESDPREFGAIYYLFAASETAREAIRNLIRYVRVVNSAEAFSLLEGTSHAVIEGKPTMRIEGLGRQMFEYEDAVFIGALRKLTGEHITPLLMEFDHHRNSSIDELEKFFGCPVHFGADRHRVTLSSESLDAPFHSADPYLLKFIRTFCEEALLRRPVSSAPLRAQVEGLAAELLPKGKATVANIAKTLGMSKRTFARRLGEEGTSYAALLDQLRHDLAMRYLEDKDLEISEIAWLLGYSEASSFNHAFRRWTATSPKVARSKLNDRNFSEAGQPPLDGTS
jgi:AraC-like DNA-binding protein